MNQRVSKSITWRNQLVYLEVIESSNNLLKTLQIACLDRIEQDLLFHLEFYCFLLLLKQFILFMYLRTFRTSTANWATVGAIGFLRALFTFTEVAWAALIFINDSHSPFIFCATSGSIIIKGTSIIIIFLGQHFWLLGWLSCKKIQSRIYYGDGIRPHCR